MCSLKVTKEKLPNSLLALDIELDQDRVDKALDRVARRIAQQHPFPGFRKGKAPRFIVERKFGREMLLEEASEGLIQKAFQEVLQQEAIHPIGQAQIESVDPSDPFRFRVIVPVPPVADLPDYRAIRIPLEVIEVTDEMVHHALERLRDKHVLLQELDEPRPVQAGDQLSVKAELFLEGEQVQPPPDPSKDTRDMTIVMEQDRLTIGLYEGLLGMCIDEEREIQVTMPQDHPEAQLQGREVTFKVHLVGIQERVLPSWDEVKDLEQFEGTVDEWRAATRQRLEQSVVTRAEQQVAEHFFHQLVTQTACEIPETMVRHLAEGYLADQERQYQNYGLTLEQVLEYNNKTREQTLEEMLPQAEQQLRVTLVLQEFARREQLAIQNEELEAEVQQKVESANFHEDGRYSMVQSASTDLREGIAQDIFNRKLHMRMLAIARGDVEDLPSIDQAPVYTTDTEPLSQPEADSGHSAIVSGDVVIESSHEDDVEEQRA